MKVIDRRKFNRSPEQKAVDEAETAMFGAPLRESVIWIQGLKVQGKMMPLEKYQELYNQIIEAGHAVNISDQIVGIHLEKKDENYKPKKQKTLGIKKRKK